MKIDSEPGRFDNLRVWQKAFDLGQSVFRLTSAKAFYREYQIKDQLRRAALSVSSNVAEGQGRFGRGQFRYFLSVANGSIYELISQIYFARELGLISKEESADLVAECTVVSRMLKKLRASVGV